MSSRWSAGDFLAKARELSRRLRSWHIEDFRSPVHFVSQRESRGWVRLTFREIIANVIANFHPRPGAGLQFFMNDGSEPDDEGCAGEAYRNPDRDTDRYLTMWLMGDFLRYLDDAPPLPALDYLKGSFGHILDVPAWIVRGPDPGEPWPEKYGPDEQGQLRGYMVTGRSVPTELLEALTDAAERLLATAPGDWGAVMRPAPGSTPPGTTTENSMAGADPPEVFATRQRAKQQEREEQDRLRAERLARRRRMAEAVSPLLGLLPFSGPNAKRAPFSDDFRRRMSDALQTAGKMIRDEGLAQTIVALKVSSDAHGCALSLLQKAAAGDEPAIAQGLTFLAEIQEEDDRQDVWNELRNLADQLLHDWLETRLAMQQTLAGDPRHGEGTGHPHDQSETEQSREGGCIVSEPVRFSLLAFELLGIDGVPAPRMDGYEGDPYLTDEQYQELCIRVCELVPGQTAKEWWDASQGQRIALMRAALRARDTKEQAGRRATGAGTAQVEDRQESERQPSKQSPAELPTPTNTESTVRPDGPFGTDEFRYQNVTVKFGRAAKQRSLVLALWDRPNCRPLDARPIEDVLTDVYGEGHDAEDAAFRQLCADTRRRFESSAMPLTIEIAQGYVRLTPRPL